MSNIYGQVYGFSKEVITSIDQLYPGDHIAYERVKLYWHHVIVEDVNKTTNEVNIIHYHNNIKEFFETTLNEGSIAQVLRNTLQFWSKRWVQSKKLLSNSMCYVVYYVVSLSCRKVLNCNIFQTGFIVLFMVILR